MTKLNRSNLWNLESYAMERTRFRTQVINHKKNRQVPLGGHATLYFEDFITMKYQVQEMLRVERIFEPDAIQAEIDAYNPMIPDGSNWKATFMLEYADAEQRREALARMTGIEHRIWIAIGTHDPVYAIANEDLERSNDEKTSAVHFLRFELDADQINALHSGERLTMGIDHPAMQCSIEVGELVRASLISDLG
ncbi:MAG: DUF3501 family protein [Pseudomonadales bacterium]|jgi:hypothetical protein|nr:DUF3501 family protein [Pseudomonadales bacterium]MDP6470279.1 DUF3501 family protein [Pseudomonadales bacterium]MDP6827185.1 DUF3501 family protein [Pseudomonadales bacterium]MDP6972384.1 DUF3501 family protein [Pseudomonadales bacterium]|tara:strand:+ start:2477 stop:3058 length:582 start_codon:yes stop_codon:yes gene_type:complete